MTTIKTAISIRKSLFERVDSLAEELHMPRSQLFALAVEEFVERYYSRKMLEALNEVYADAPDPDDTTLREGMRQRHERLVEGQW